MALMSSVVLLLSSDPLEAVKADRALPNLTGRIKF
jgi:hypothetical protein